MDFMDVYNKYKTPMGYAIINNITPEEMADALNGSDTILLMAYAKPLGKEYEMTYKRFLLISKTVNDKKYDLIFEINVSNDAPLWIKTFPMLKDHRIKVVTDMMWTDDLGITASSYTKDLYINSVKQLYDVLLDHYKPPSYDSQECQQLLKKYENAPSIMMKVKIKEELDENFPFAFEYHELFRKKIISLFSQESQKEQKQNEENRKIKIGH